MKAIVAPNGIPERVCNPAHAEGCLTCKFHDLIVQMSHQKLSNPYEFLHLLKDDAVNPKYSDWKQDDAYDFFTDMIFMMNSDVTVELSIEHVTFSTCVNTCTPQQVVESYVGIPLLIDGFESLESALENYFEPVELEAKCTCGGTQILSYHLQTPPKYLMLHLKRFNYVTSMGEHGYIEKLTHDLPFPEKVQLNTSGTSSVYKFFASIMHTGTSTSCGHYTTYLNHQNRLLFYNDGYVSEKLFEDIDFSEVYVVIFKKVDEDFSQPRTVICSPSSSPFKGYDAASDNSESQQFSSSLSSKKNSAKRKCLSPSKNPKKNARTEGSEQNFDIPRQISRPHDIIDDIELFMNNQLPPHTAAFLESLHTMSNEELIRLGPMQTNCK